MTVERVLLLDIWLSMLAGGLSGAAIGLFFHDADWLGGYSSFRRRLLRLGHIAFFGIAFVVVAFYVTLPAIETAAAAESIATCLVIANVTMPLCCFLAAWRPNFRHLFPVPVVALAAGIVQTLAALR